MNRYENSTYEAMQYGIIAMEAVAALFSNPKIAEAMKVSKRQIDWVKPMVQYEPDAVIDLIAAHRRQDPDDVAARITPMTLPVGLLQVLGDPEMQELFTSAGQKTEDASSGSRTESTEGSAET